MSSATRRHSEREIVDLTPAFNYNRSSFCLFFLVNYVDKFSCNTACSLPNCRDF